VAEQFVPADFEVPLGFEGPGFHLEPLGPVHNERDYQAWMLSIDHINATPGMDWGTWPSPMTLEENLADMEMHAREFAYRSGFTYSILDGDLVIGCVYIYPGESGYDAHVRSWVTESRAEMDRVVWRSISGWLEAEWPFVSIDYAPRG
jgi:hypothetical protein